MTVPQQAIDAAAEALASSTSDDVRDKITAALEAGAPFLRAEWEAESQSANDLYDEVKSVQHRRELDTLRTQLTQVDDLLRANGHEGMPRHEALAALRTQLAALTAQLQTVREATIRECIAYVKPKMASWPGNPSNMIERHLLALLTPTDEDGSK